MVSFFLKVIREAQEYWSRWPCPCPGESSRPRNWTQVSHIAGRFLTIWATREAQFDHRAPHFGVKFFGTMNYPLGKWWLELHFGSTATIADKPSLQAGISLPHGGSHRAQHCSPFYCLWLFYFGLSWPLCCLTTNKSWKFDVPWLWLFSPFS